MEKYQGTVEEHKFSFCNGKAEINNDVPGVVFGVDFFDEKRDNNNVCLFGGAGTGKSSMLGEIAYSYHLHGAQIRVIDCFHQTMHLCKKLGGEVIEINHKANISLNPFLLIDDLDKDIWLLKYLIAQMGSPNKFLVDVELDHIESVVRESWAVNGKLTTITDIYNALIKKSATGIFKNSFDEFCINLFEYTLDGKSGSYVHGTPNIEFYSNFGLVDIDGQHETIEVRTILSMLVMFKLTKDMCMAPVFQRKVILVDEYLNLWISLNYKEFIVKIYETANANNGFFVTSEQRLSDGEGSIGMTAMVEKSYWLLFLHPRLEDFNHIKKLSAFSNWNSDIETMLKSVRFNRGHSNEIFIKEGKGGYKIVRMLFDEYSKLLLSNHPQDYTDIKTKMDNGLKFADAVDNIVKDIK